MELRELKKLKQINNNIEKNILKSLNKEKPRPVQIPADL
jgi:hypothetical protein